MIKKLKVNKKVIVGMLTVSLAMTGSNLIKKENLVNYSNLQKETNFTQEEQSISGEKKFLGIEEKKAFGITGADIRYCNEQISKINMFDKYINLNYDEEILSQIESYVNNAVVGENGVVKINSSDSVDNVKIANGMTEFDLVIAKRDNKLISLVISELDKDGNRVQYNIFLRENNNNHTIIMFLNNNFKFISRNCIDSSLSNYSYENHNGDNYHNDFKTSKVFDDLLNLYNKIGISSVTEVGKQILINDSILNKQLIKF